MLTEIILKMVMSLKVTCLSSSVEKQPSDPCLHEWMPDVSYLCLISGSQTLKGDDDDYAYCNGLSGATNFLISLIFFKVQQFMS